MNELEATYTEGRYSRTKIILRIQNSNVVRAGYFQNQEIKILSWPSHYYPFHQILFHKIDQIIYFTDIF